MNPNIKNRTTFALYKQMTIKNSSVTEQKVLKVLKKLSKNYAKTYQRIKKLSDNLNFSQILKIGDHYIGDSQYDQKNTNKINTDCSNYVIIDNLCLKNIKKAFKRIKTNDKQTLNLIALTIIIQSIKYVGKDKLTSPARYRVFDHVYMTKHAQTI